MASPGDVPNPMRSTSSLGNPYPTFATPKVPAVKRRAPRANGSPARYGDERAHLNGHATGNANGSPPQEQQVQRHSTASSEDTNNTTGTPGPSYPLLEKRKLDIAPEKDPKLEPNQQKKARNAVPAKEEGYEPKKRGPKKPTILVEVDDTIIQNPVRHNSGDASMNGLRNGLASGHANGHVNDNANGHTDGHPFGNPTLDNNSGNMNMDEFTNGLTNEQTHGHVGNNSNGHINGDTLGNLTAELNAALDENLAEHNSGDMIMLGLPNELANGLVNGSFHGYADGNFSAYINGDFNGFTNGNINANTDGDFNGFINDNINGNGNLGDSVNELPTASDTSAYSAIPSFGLSSLLPLRQHPVQSSSQSSVEFPPIQVDQRQWQWNGDYYQESVFSDAQGGNAGMNGSINTPNSKPRSIDGQ
ncbi:hypothetical protein B0T09DRAFT_367122 [Sordaria sp. MPI-SDFR-AT-0083]|nr:hypothetical protein B0T09DRAFT_367122 [Sordaria sp. MPI-SDFR-AT-0083]